jgi:tyrosine-protein kinase Etk/Wzc
MNDMLSKANESVPPASARQFDAIDLLIVLAKRKKLILCTPIVAGVAAALISLAIPNSFKAGVKLLPPQQAQSSAAALLSQLGGLAGAAAGAAGIKNPNDLYVAMLRSRTISDKLIAKFDLMKVYKTESKERARKVLENNTMVGAGKEGLITIEVEDESQQMVAPLANAYVEELSNLTKVLAVTEAAQRRVFFAKQLEIAKDNLANAEIKLKGSLDTHGVISVDADSRAIVETVARVRALISAKEIELNAMEAFVTPNNQNYKRAQEQLSSLRNELSKLENGRPAVAGRVEQGPNPIGLENIKTLRDVKYYQMLYELLAKQFEAARLDEAKDSSVIQVLDPAIEPERKFKPARAIITIVFAMLGLFAAIAYVLLADTKDRITRRGDRAAQLGQLRAHLRFR